MFAIEPMKQGQQRNEGHAEAPVAWGLSLPEISQGGTGSDAAGLVL